MKKVLTLALAAILALSLTACGGGEDTPNTPDVSTPVGAVSDISEPAGSQPAPSQSAAPDASEPAGSQPTFDASWASNDFEAQIPQPFFEVAKTDWTVENAAYFLHGPLTTEQDPVDELRAYVDELRACGFNAKEVEYDFLDKGSTYAFAGWNEETNFCVYVEYDETTQADLLVSSVTPDSAVYISVFDCGQDLTGKNLPEVAYMMYMDATA